jgi:hypothetical protein
MPSIRLVELARQGGGAGTYIVEGCVCVCV